jgi:hypothetical protein
MLEATGHLLVRTNLVRSCEDVFGDEGIAVQVLSGVADPVSFTILQNVGFETCVEKGSTLESKE